VSYLSAYLCVRPYACDNWKTDEGNVIEFVREEFW